MGLTTHILTLTKSPQLHFETFIINRALLSSSSSMPISTRVNHYQLSKWANNCVNSKKWLELWKSGQVGAGLCQKCLSQPYTRRRHLAQVRHDYIYINIYLLRVRVIAELCHAPAEQIRAEQSGAHVKPSSPSSRAGLREETETEAGHGDNTTTTSDWLGDAL